MEAEQNRERMAEARQQVEEAASTSARPPRPSSKAGLAGPDRRDPRRPAAERRPRRPPQAGVEPVLRRPDRDAQPGPAARRGPGEASPSSSTPGRSAPVRRSATPRIAGSSSKGLERAAGEARGPRRADATTVNEAEETEPLLAKNLFDAARKADEQTVPETLKEAEQLADAGFADEAAKSSPSRRRGHRPAPRRASNGPPGASWATRPPPCGGPRARSKTSRTSSTARSRRPTGTTGQPAPAPENAARAPRDPADEHQPGGREDSKMNRATGGKASRG